MTANNDLLYTFTGLSSPQLVSTVSTLLNKRHNLQSQLVEGLTRHPPESLVGFTLSTTAAFYLAERATNPQVNSYIDALYYISTCLTVGYADLFPVTQQGRFIASFVMTFGPALTNNTLDPPGRERPSSAKGQTAMLERLDEILAQLKT